MPGISRHLFRRPWTPWSASSGQFSLSMKTNDLHERAGPIPMGRLNALRGNIYRHADPLQKKSSSGNRSVTLARGRVITGAISGLVLLDFDGEAGRETCRQL